MQAHADQLTNVLPVLTQDDSGLTVAILQRLLAFYGHLPNESVNGIFDDATENAVRQFQHDNGLCEDGIAGSHTWQLLADMTESA